MENKYAFMLKLKSTTVTLTADVSCCHIEFGKLLKRAIPCFVYDKICHVLKPYCAWQGSKIDNLLRMKDFNVLESR